MSQWVRSWVDPLSEQQMQRVLLVEYGGMGEVLSNLYGVTGKREYLQIWRGGSIRNGSSMHWRLIAMNSKDCTSTRTFRK